MPTDFNLNIAESQGSLDFDISDSKNTFAHQYTVNNSASGLRIDDKPNGGGVQRRSTYVEMMKKKMDEQQDDNNNNS